MTTSPTIKDWLSIDTRESKTARYLHCLLKENVKYRPYFFEHLTTYVEKAHTDARRFWLNVTDSLDPLEQDISNDLSGYPSLLPMQTLKGYFGEIFAALAVENFAPFGEDNWKVPAHLFRWHNAAFEYLEKLRMGGKELQSVVGRTGDDCLAFQINDAGQIIKVLYCEAKCTSTHNAQMIKEAHEKVGQSGLASLLHLIETLSSQNDDQAKIWVNALRQLRLQRRPDFERYDLVSYICGQHPIRAETWMSRDIPHDEYKGEHLLQVVEVHLHRVDELVRTIYCKADDDSGSTDN